MEHGVYDLPKVVNTVDVGSHWDEFILLRVPQGVIFQITRHIYLSLGHILNSFCLALCALRLLARIFYYTLYSALALPPLFLAYLDALSAYTDKLQCLSDGSVDEGFQWSWLSGSLVSCFVVVYIVLYVVYIVYILLFGSFPVIIPPFSLCIYLFT